MLESPVRKRATTAPLTIAAPILRSIEWPAVSLRAANLGFASRIAAVIALSLVAYGVGYAQVVTHAFAGSGAAFLVVAPLLAGLITTGYRAAPRGVGDAESDWIVAILVGGIGFGGIELLALRAPTLAGLWGLPLLGAVLWFACCLTVMFGVRHVARMWPMWLFAVIATTPLPFLLAAAAFGGSDTAAGLVAAFMGAVAVFLATRMTGMRWRLSATFTTFAIAALVVVTMGRSLGTVATVAVVAGLLPVAAVVVSARFRRPAQTALGDLKDALPRRSATSVAVLAVAAAALLLTSPPAVPAADVPSANADWPRLAGLSDPESISFANRFFGPESTLVRYGVPARPGVPAAAVDVISAPGRARLDDFADAVFYPSSRPVDFQAAEDSAVLPAGARILYSNADAATDDTGLDWYAVSWLWRAGEAYQRVTVIVNQKIGDQMPPAPQPLTLHNTAVRPAAWFARQQPDDRGLVDPLVTRRAADVIALITGPDGG